jgi:inward rectifier potassium channel
MSQKKHGSLRFVDNEGRLTARRLGVPKDPLRDLYHALMAMPWWHFLLLLAAAWALISLAFALAYWAGGDCIEGAHPGSLADAFYFSVQTLGTIGYGGMTPKGHYANILVCFQAFAGVLTIATMSGLFFAKFSVPRTRVLFSHNLVVGRRNGLPVLQCRMANARGNGIVEARVAITMSIGESTTEGERIRRLVRLPLVVAETPVFAISFSASHLIDHNSPLHNLSPEDLRQGGAEFIVTLVGLDETLSQTVHARRGYACGDILWDRRFADTLSFDEDGRPLLDLRVFHETVELQGV